MSQYFLVDFDTALIPSLSNLGLTHKPETACWMRPSVKKGILPQLLVGNIFSAPDESQNWHHISLKNESNTESLVALFSQFLNELIAQVSFLGIKPESSSYLFFNFLAFNVPVSKIDRIIEGLALQAESKKFFNHFAGTVILTRSASMFNGSVQFKRLAEYTCLGVFDLVGVGFHSDGKRGGLKSTSSPREIFSEFLAIPEAEIQKSLTRETNTFIGNFELENSRVRTHYDLEQFARRDEFLDYVFRKISNLVSKWETFLIVGTGFERNALEAVAHHYSAGRQGVQTAEYLQADDSHFIENVLPNWSQLYGGVLLLADIVNSGETLKKTFRLLQKTNQNSKPIEVFALTVMKNSITKIDEFSITHALRVPRTFYELDDLKCPLTLFKQPSQKVLRLEDFRTVHPNQPTPYDFWEMVGECNALQPSGSGLQQSAGFLRVDVVKILKKYSGWLKNVIRSRWENEFGDTPVTTLVALDEPGGMAFANLVQQAFSTRRLKIVSIQRSELEKAMPTYLPQSIKEQFGDGDVSLLIVDDGVNEGKTIRQLIAVCRGVGMLPVGALVLTSRLTHEREMGLQTQIKPGRFVPLYTWPADSKIRDSLHLVPT